MQSQGASLFPFLLWGWGGGGEVNLVRRPGRAPRSCTQSVDTHSCLSLTSFPSTPTKQKTKVGRKRGPNIQIPKVPRDKVGCFLAFVYFYLQTKCHNNKPKQRLSLLLRSQCGLAGRVIYKPAGDWNSALSQPQEFWNCIPSHSKKQGGYDPWSTTC